MMNGIAEAFASMPDPRRPNARHHKLVDILTIAFCASLCGAESCVDMAGFAQSKEDVLGEFLDMDNGPPSHDTFSRVFRLLDPEAFGACFAAYLSRFADACKGHVAIDGKALAGPCLRRQNHGHAGKKWSKLRPDPLLSFKPRHAG